MFRKFLGLAVVALALAPAPAQASSGPPVAGYPCSGCPAAKAVTLLADGSGGYVLDAYGALHRFGSAPDVGSAPLWNWDIARSLVLRPAGGGYILDGWGGIHPFGGAPVVGGSPYWQGWDIARSLTLRSNGSSGWVLDGFGGVHAFGGAPGLQASSYWPNWDIARAVVADGDGGGEVLDGYGALHRFGSAPAISAPPGGYVAQSNYAKGVVLSSATSGYTVDEYGEVHRFGGATPVQVSDTTAGQDLARGIALKPDGSGYVLFANGELAPFTPINTTKTVYINVPTPPPPPPPGHRGRKWVTTVFDPSWHGDAKHIRVTSAKLLGKVPRRITITILCKGRGCPVRRRWSAHTASGAVSPLRYRWLLPGTKIFVTMAAPGKHSERLVYIVRAGQLPLVVRL